ncbi:MAG: SH3 domain-containing protein [Saprospiraceae bacterium]|nr:SH3 domain-containing protein [Lewinella sp.]
MKTVKFSGHGLTFQPPLNTKEGLSISQLVFVLLLAITPALTVARTACSSVASPMVLPFSGPLPRDTTPPGSDLVPLQNLILTGTAHDIITNEVVMGVQVELYRIMEEEKAEMAYSGVFLNGQFKIPVSAMHNHLLVLSRQGYEARKILVKQGQVDFDDEELMMHRSDSSEILASAAFPLKNPVERSPSIAEPQTPPVQEALPPTPRIEATTASEPVLLSRVETPSAQQNRPDPLPEEKSQPRQPSIKTLPEEKGTLPQAEEETIEEPAKIVEEELPVEEIEEKEINVEELIEDEMITEEVSIVHTEPEAGSVAPEVPAEPTARVEGNHYSLSHSTSLWQGPIHTSNVLAYLEAGEQVEVVKKTGKWWWKVRFGDQTGYVKAELLVQ